MGLRHVIYLCLYVAVLVGVSAEYRPWEDVDPTARDRQRRGQAEGEYLNAFAIVLNEGHGKAEAEALAAEHGFRLKTVLPHSNVYILGHNELGRRSKRSSRGHLESLQNDPRVAYAQQEELLQRYKRRIMYDKQLELPIRTISDSKLYKRVEETPNLARRDSMGSGEGEYLPHTPKFKDPYFNDMWYLNNRGQSGGEYGLDLNVGVVWQNGITGKGVVVTILDDGVDHTHPDLQENYDPEASTDLNDKYDMADDPMPDTSDSYNSHGTRCAGEIAATADNYVCGVGVAYNAKIGGVRILDGVISDALEAEALSFNRHYIDIYSASWGPVDDGTTMEGPRHLSLKAIQEGVRKGRKGLGSIFVWATGNGGMYKDDCSADGYVARPETLAVGTVNDWGRSPFFTENCSSTLAVVPSGGEDYQGQEKDNGETKLKVVTTDMNGGCIENFQGTSSAAPLAAGCVANVLQANPSLTWRDVQHIVVQGSRVPSVDSSWTINGAGRHVSHRFGFGLMDCGRMVALAQEWPLVSEQRVCNTTRESFKPLKYNGHVSETFMSDGCLTTDDEAAGPIDRLEHVQVYVRMTSKFRGDLSIALISPSGTRSVLLSPRPLDDHSGYWEFGFMTVHNWDESPRGLWRLDIHHRPSADSSSSGSSSSSGDSEDEAQAHKESHSSGSDENGGSSMFGYLLDWSLSLYGTHGTRHNRARVSRDRKQAAYQPSQRDLTHIKKKEALVARSVSVKRNMPGQDKVGYSSRSGWRSQSGGDDSLSREEMLAQTVYNLLHEHGARDVKKRVFEDGGQGRPEGGRYKSNRQSVDSSDGGTDGVKSYESKVDELARLLVEVINS